MRKQTNISETQNYMNFEDFQNKFGIRLNDSQKKAVLENDKPVALISVPGSGKTTTLISKVGYLIYVLGVNPEEILTISYTKSAASDMRRRYIEIFGDEYADKTTFKTINSMCYQVVRDAFSRGLMPERQMETKVARYMLDAFYAVSKQFASESEIKDVQLGLSYLKNKLYKSMSDDKCICGGDIINKSSISRKFDINKNSILDIYECYQAILEKNKLMDYDDQLTYTYYLFNEHEDFLKEYQKRYKYILVDEVQDTSYAQHKIIEQLYKGGGNQLFIVGDDDQSIYSFRGAVPKLLLDFKKQYKDGTIIYLMENYRSTPEIVSVANAFIKANKNRYSKEMIAHKESGEDINILSMKRSDQYEYIAKKAREKKETAVIYRNNDTAIPIMLHLDAQCIPYNVKNMDASFFSHPVVRDVKNFLHFALHPADVDLYQKIAFKTGCFLSASHVKSTVQLFDPEKDASLWDVTCRNPEIPPYVRNACKILQTYFTQLGNQTAFGALKTIETHLRNNSDDDSYKYYVLQRIAKDRMPIGEFIESITKAENKIRSHKNSENATLTLSTAHSSKGLEFDNVIIVDAIDRIWPIGGRTELEEERRLFYVAMTRAKSSLTILKYTDTNLRRQYFVGNIETIQKKAEKIAIIEERAALAQQGDDKKAVNPVLTMRLEKEQKKKEHDELIKSSQKAIERIKTSQDKFAKSKDIPVYHDFKPGDKVIHKKYKKGIIKNITDNKMIIDFDTYGEKSFLISVLLNNNLLTKEL